MKDLIVGGVLVALGISWVKQRRKIKDQQEALNRWEERWSSEMNELKKAQQQAHKSAA